MPNRYMDLAVAVALIVVGKLFITLVKLLFGG